MTVNLDNQQEVAEQAQKMVDVNLLILLEENRTAEEASEVSKTPSSNVEEGPPIYFR